MVSDSLNWPALSGEPRMMPAEASLTKTSADIMSMQVAM
eukprot:CAMPEP_0115587124 /NCGR_PEP_ID=MMETSP0272-20121206/8045_1 /TAXON_ID=71861 /ORGANISM="Scrippsiella trochoidea, Strain CCMP3099" /LENGTH=38 /DNA_ID= /DNA_START= /DNA_END= /DNA_ORIENTATION=